MEREKRREYERNYYHNNPDAQEKKLARQKKYYETHRSEIRVRQRVSGAKYWKGLKKKCVDAYGGSCACCGESRLEFLAIDHTNGGGNKWRKEMNFKRGRDTYRWLIKNNFPLGFRVLCHNCNVSLGHYGYCPHKRE
jgi:hypothetical protein